MLSVDRILQQSQVQHTRSALNAENPLRRKWLLRMRNDKSACNLELFHTALRKLEKNNEHDTTSLSVQFEDPAVKSRGIDNDTSRVKGALTYPERC